MWSCWILKETSSASHRRSSSIGSGAVAPSAKLPIGARGHQLASVNRCSQRAEVGRVPVRSLHVTTVLILFRVASFDEWRPRYDNALERTIGVKSAQILGGQDDPDLVVIVEVFESREAARAALSVPDLQDEMAADGVDLSSVRVEFLDDAGHIER